jgi:hypothetical protein
MYLKKRKTAQGIIGFLSRFYDLMISSTEDRAGQQAISLSGLPIEIVLTLPEDKSKQL